MSLKLKAQRAGYGEPVSASAQQRANSAWLRDFAFPLFAGILPDSMSPVTASVLLGLTAGFANIFGGAVIVQKHWDRRFLRYFVALGAGFMLGTALLQMLPESFALSPRAAGLFVLLGYFIIHFFEHTISSHFHFGEETHADEFGHRRRGYSVLLGLMIHTFFDGIAITSGFLVSNLLGWLIFLAVFLHKVPEGFTVSSVMLASGRSRAAAWGSSVLLAGATLAGVLTMLAWQRSVSFGLPVSAGVTIYVAASDLIPEVNREPGVKMALVVFLGVGLMFALVHLLQIP
jgi:ZIP family zinc transporter/zinc and cadmium transporter